jgi:hypothetical protein
MRITYARLRAFWVTLFAFAVVGSAAMAGPSETVVYEADGLHATAHTDCDMSAYTVVTLGEAYDASRYAANGSFATLIEPHLEEIFSRSAAWLDGLGKCDAGPEAETITVIGVVSTLPVFATAAARDLDWRPGSTTANPRDIAALAAALPSPEQIDCDAYTATIAPAVAKHKTKTFTIRAAHTTGQWSHMVALEAIVPLHRTIMDLVGAWGLEWRCDGIHELTKLAVQVDLERADLLAEGERDILQRLAGVSAPQAVTAEMTAVFRFPDYPTQMSFHEILTEIGGEARVRYGGFTFPVVARLDSAFAERGAIAR